MLTQLEKGQNFIQPIAVGQFMLEKLLKLILKNRTDNTLSGAWSCELLSDWSQTLFGS